MFSTPVKIHTLGKDKVSLDFLSKRKLSCEVPIQKISMFFNDVTYIEVFDNISMAKWGSSLLLRELSFVNINLILKT